jgi:uncharacterized protein DUF4406
MRVYLSGPMRGYPCFNFLSFDYAKKILEAAGHEVYSPADFDREAYPFHDFSTNTEPEGWDINHVLSNDFIAVCKCDAIYLLKGWENSVGGKQELAVALAASKKVMVQ